MQRESDRLRAEGRYVVLYTRPLRIGDGPAVERPVIFGDYATAEAAENGLADLKRSYFWSPNHKAEILPPTTAPAAPAAPEAPDAPCGGAHGHAARLHALTQPRPKLPPATGATVEDFAFEISPCGRFLGVRWDGEVIGMLVPGTMGGLWTARSKDGQRSFPDVLAACAWMLASWAGVSESVVRRG